MSPPDKSCDLWENDGTRVSNIDEREIVKSRPAQYDPHDSLECLNCHNDVTNAIIDEITHCPYCGQRIQEAQA